MTRKSRDFDYMRRKRLEEQDTAYNIRFAQEQKAAQERIRARRPNHWGDKFASDLRYLVALGVL